MLNAINRERTKHGLAPVSIEYLSDEQRLVQAAVGLQGYWVEEITPEGGQPHYTLAHLHQTQDGRWEHTGWGPEPRDGWVSTGYHFDLSGRRLFYSYTLGPTQTRGEGFGCVVLNTPRSGGKQTPLTGWFVNLEQSGPERFFAGT